MVLILILVIASLASYKTAMLYYTRARLDPAIVLDNALNNTAASESYKYTLHSGFTVEDRKEVISEVAGERQQSNIHIKGEMVNTPVDIYYIDQTVYNFDSFSNKWLVIDSGTSNPEELLISELNPLSNFRFKNVNQVEKVKFEKIAGVDCIVVKCHPSVESQLLENLWKDFEYMIWVDYRNSNIRQAILTATNKRNDKTHLEIKVGFSDFGKNMEIKPPDTTSSSKK